MKDEPPRGEGRRGIDLEDARADFTAGVIATIARWLQFAAAIWLGLRLHAAPAVPAPLGAVLFGLSWIAMIGSTFVTAAIAYRRPNLRRGLILTVLLWMLLGVLSLIAV